MQQVDLFFGLIFLWLFILSLFLFKVFRHYQRLTSGISKKDLKSVLDRVLEEIKHNKKEIGEVFKKYDEVKKKGSFHIQKIGFLRYNPFKLTGGNQSFIIALLDEHDNGLILTSLHSREATRIYAKPVKEGEAEKYNLSPEEKKVIKKARKASFL